MKHKKSLTASRVLAVLAAILITLTVTVLPTLALDGHMGMRHGMKNGRMGEATDPPPIGQGIENAVDDVTDGIDDIIDGVTEIPRGTESDTVSDTETEGSLLGDESLVDGTNIPDTDIGGAVADNDGDGLSDPADSDDDNDGVLDPVDTDANGDGTADDSRTAGLIGIAVAVIIVIAIVILILAVMPRGRNKK